VSILSLFELSDEFIKCGVAITDTRSIAENGVEAGWLAIVKQADLLITLNRVSDELRQIQARGPA
jgi:hypothetical protein